MGKPGAKAYSVINDLLKKARGKGGKSPLKQQNLPLKRGYGDNKYM